MKELEQMEGTYFREGVDVTKAKVGIGGILIMIKTNKVGDFLLRRVGGI